MASHLGPVTGRRYDFPVREVAAAFVAVGSGTSYQQAALPGRCQPAGVDRGRRGQRGDLTGR